MKNMTSLLTVIVGVLAAVSLWAARPGPTDAGRTSAQAAPARTVHTSGTAVIRVQPDKATLRLGVQTFDGTPRGSQAENARITERVLEAIRKQGIPAKDIATDYFSVRPETDYKQYGERKIVGYWTDNAVVVTLRDVDKLSDVLVAALEAGATTVDDLTFTTTRLRELRDQAREMAVKAAQEKAEALAGAVKLSTGEVQTISENSWSYDDGPWNSRGQMLANVQQNMAQAAQNGAPQPEDGEFSLGQIVVQAQVELTVGIR